MANLLWAFTSLDRYTEPLFDHISGILIPSLNVGQVNPQEVSNTLWAYATAKYTGKYRLELMRISAQLLESNEELLNSFNPQEFSNTAWALATILGERRTTENLQVNNTQQDLEDSYCVRILRPVAHALSSRCDEFKSQEISNSVWALGCLGFGAGKELSSRPLLNDHIILKSDDHDGDEKLVQSALATVSKSATTRLGVFKEQELNNLAYGFARLQIPAPELCQTIADEFTSPRRRLSGQDIATTLWSFASLQFFDKDSFCKVASRVRYNQVERWNPQELSNVIWAIGTAQIVPTYYKAFDYSFVPPNERLPIEQVLQDPLSLCFAASARELMKRPQEFKVQEIKDMLWGFSKSGVRHPRLFRSVAEHLVGSAVDMPEHPNIHCGRGLDEFSSRIMASLLWTFAKQAQLAAEYNYAHFSGRMAVYCASSIDIGDTLIKRLVNAALVAGLENFDDLSLHTTTDLSNTIWAMATLGYYHGPFVNAVERQVIDRLDSCYDPNNEYDQNSFRSQELANIVWSLACTNSLSAELITSVGERIKNIVSNEAGEYDVKSISSHFQRRELANLVWSCAVAGCYPPELIRILVIGLVGEGEDTAESVEEFYGDGGLAEHSIMTLLYLRSAIDTDGFSMGISLPPNFPSGWGGLGKSGIFDENEVVLNLRPSKIQNSVSAAFDRIGFGHVDEYVLKMQGLNLLSIDIASPVEKIGVEVDGPSHFYVDLDEWSPHEPQRGYAEVMNRKLEYRFEFNGKVDKPNGSSALKDRLLRNLGWTILHVPYGEWYDLGGDSDAEEAYCRALLEQRIEK